MKKNLLILIILALFGVVTAVAAGNDVYASMAKSKKFVLVIDAGHGGNDAGAIGKITKEKTINLNVALAFGRLVERNCSDVKVVYTRKTDVFIPLHTRADIANRNKADLFVSIHTNALPKGRISRGMETYTLGMHRASDNLEVAKRENEVILYEKDYKQRYQGFDPSSSESYIMFEFMQDHNMAQSVELAKFVQKRTCASAGRQDKGVKQAGFLVLRETSMPSCLIELGFISTPDEEQFLHSPAGVSSMAQGIFLAFLDYKKKHYGGITVPMKPEEKSEVDIPAVVPKGEEPKKEEARQEEKPKKRKKSQVAQELEDARENRLPAVVETVPTAPNADSILAAGRRNDVAQVQSPVKPAEPVKPVEPVKTVETVKPAPVKTVEPVKPAPAVAPVAATAASAPVFKVQILASGYQLKANDGQLKGQHAAFYQEDGLYKYTVGSSADYNEINQLRKSLAASFPQCFIVAFKDGVKMNVQQAIQEYKQQKK